MPRRFEDDHLKAAQGPWAAFDRLFRLLLNLERGVAVAREYRGRYEAQKRADEARQRIETNAVSGLLQNDQLGTLADMEALGMLEPNGPFLCFFEGHPVYMSSPMHMAIQGLSGSGKGVSYSIPAHIRLAQTGAESFVSLDVKNAEMEWIVGPGIERITGRPLDRINPFHMRGAPSARINYLDNLIRAAAIRRPGIVDDATVKMHVTFGEMIEKAGVNSWIPTTAREISTTLALFRAFHDPALLTPGGMWDFSKATHAEFAETMEEASHSDACDGYVALCARKLLDQYGREPTQQWDWVMEAMGTAWGLYGRGGWLRQESEATDIDFTAYKREPRQCMIMWPDEYLLSHSRHFTLLLDYIVETIAHAEGPMRTSIFCDELASWPRVPNMLKFLRMYRELGIRLVTFATDRSSYRAYQDHGGHEPFEENSWAMYWGMKNAGHIREIEARAGYKSVLVPNASASFGYQAEGQNDGASEQITPILPAARIGQICDGQAILEVPGYKLWVVERRPFWEFPEVAPFVRDRRAEPVPAFRPSAFR